MNYIPIVKVGFTGSKYTMLSHLIKKPSFFLFFQVKFCGIPLPPVHMQIEGSSGSYTESYAPLSKGVAKDTSYFVF